MNTLKGYRIFSTLDCLTLMLALALEMSKPARRNKWKQISPLLMLM